MLGSEGEPAETQDAADVAAEKESAGDMNKPHDDEKAAGDDGDADATRQQTKMPEEQKNTLLDAIMQVMEHGDEFCDSDFGIERLATLVGSNSKYVSQVINDVYSKNFRTFRVPGEEGHDADERHRELWSVHHQGHRGERGLQVAVEFHQRVHPADGDKAVGVPENIKGENNCQEWRGGGIAAEKRTFSPKIVTISRIRNCERMFFALESILFSYFCGQISNV